MESKGEMFYTDENGQKSDAALHEELLKDGEYSLELRKDLKKVAMECGLTEEQAEMIYHCNEVESEIQASMCNSDKAPPPPPDQPKIRGLQFQHLNKEQSQVVTDLVEIVNADKTLDLQIRCSYINIYYLGGNLLKISGFNSRSGRISFHFDKKYFERKNGKHLPAKLPAVPSAFSDWKCSLDRLKNVMDGWFADYPKTERQTQHELCLMHRNDNQSKWIVIDIEYAAWLHDAEKGRKLCRFDMVAVKRDSIRQGQPLTLFLIELKEGDKALSNKSGVEAHARDFLQFLNYQNDKKARSAFTDSMKNIIHEKVELGLLPKELSGIEAVEVKVKFLLKNCTKLGPDIRGELENLLCDHSNGPLFDNYESWLPLA
ncbi:MAG: hypothetical protein AB7U43_02410 [Desulfobacter sp.]